MITLRLQDNLIRLRKQRKITQEELANFLGVTKASVSKWETNQSYPDILLLPQIANFFDITIDELIGYEPYLTPEQIKKEYGDLAHLFASKPFEEAYKTSQERAKKYYSCYSFLVTIAALWVNHMMLPEQQSRQQEVMEDIVDLTLHIEKNCTDLTICNDAKGLRLFVYLQQGKASEVVDSLESILTHEHMSSHLEGLLMQAYQMTGDQKNAIKTCQVSIYNYLLEFITTSTSMISLNVSQPKQCEETIRRIEAVLKAYDIEHLHPNSFLQFHITTATFYVANHDYEKTLFHLQLFADTLYKLIDANIALSGDSYFDCLDEWLEDLPIGSPLPRDKKFILSSAITFLSSPIFAEIKDLPEFKKILKKLS